ncbi:MULTISPECIES: hypothetical protein [unclassified Streptomyces]|uniref:hypothetical protein n=1 Tax=Streptomyces sp. SID8354 TaxID=2690339 RepID=UPI00039CEDB0|nr:MULTISPECIES: hypothetical protein [unclassified Streptomyces]
MTDNEKTPAIEPVEDKLVDEVVERLMDRAEASGASLLGEGGLLTEVTRAVLERALDVEMTDTWAMRNTIRPAVARATAATGPQRRPC